jgi:hypothetical protein
VARQGAHDARRPYFHCCSEKLAFHFGKKQPPLGPAPGGDFYLTHFISDTNQVFAKIISETALVLA